MAGDDTATYSRHGRTTGLLMRAQLQRRLVTTTELAGQMRQRRLVVWWPLRGSLTTRLYSKRRPPTPIDVDVVVVALRAVDRFSEMVRRPPVQSNRSLWHDESS